MFQVLNTQRKGFSRADIAAITRGSTGVKVSGKADPVIALAKRALQQYVNVLRAREVYNLTKAKLKGRDAYHPEVECPEGLRSALRLCGRNFYFTSAHHVRCEFRRERKTHREAIAHNRKLIRARKGKDLHTGILSPFELQQRVDAHKRDLALLSSKVERRLINAVLREDRRIAREQRRTGFADAKVNSRQKRGTFSKTIEQLRASKPKSSEGALAMFDMANALLATEGGEWWGTGEYLIPFYSAATNFLHSATKN